MRQGSQVHWHVCSLGPPQPRIVSIESAIQHFGAVVLEKSKAAAPKLLQVCALLPRALAPFSMPRAFVEAHRSAVGGVR
jgi:hypothetical protein